MSAAALTGALGLPFAAAWVLLGRVFRPPRTSLAALAGQAALAALLGVGLSSLLPFAWLLTGGALGRGYVIFDAAVLIGVLVLGIMADRRGAGDATPPADARRTLAELAALGVVGAALLVAAVAFVQAARISPHGDWDAWAIWNLRARFLVRAGAGWRTAFAPELGWSQLGYPLLVPLSVARAWAYAGESTLAPAVLGAVFTFATPLALGSAVAQASGRIAGAVATLLLLGTSQLVELGATQYADVPMGAFLVAALALLARAREDEGGLRRPRLLAAGLLLGVAGWTKNEGVAAAACAVLAYGITGAPRAGKRVLADLAAVAAGAAPAALAWLVFHGAVERSVAVALAADPRSSVAKLFDAGRWRVVLRALWESRPGGEYHLLAVALALAVVLGARLRAVARSVPFIAAALLLVADAVTYVVTPQDLAWHLRSSAARVLFQAWPAVLLALFSAVPAPAAGPAVAPAVPPAPDASPGAAM